MGAGIGGCGCPVLAFAIPTKNETGLPDPLPIGYQLVAFGLGCVAKGQNVCQNIDSQAGTGVGDSFRDGGRVVS